MKKTLFLMTHPGSNWQALSDKLNEHPNIEMFCTGSRYEHPDDLFYLTRRPHKTNNANSVWGDVILHNQDFTCRALCQTSMFVFWMADFDPRHPEWKDYGDSAQTYWRMRVNGMSQYWRRCPRGMLVLDLEGNLSLDAILR